MKPRLGMTLTNCPAVVWRATRSLRNRRVTRPGAISRRCVTIDGCEGWRSVIRDVKYRKGVGVENSVEWGAVYSPEASAVAQCPGELVAACPAAAAGTVGWRAARWATARRATELLPKERPDFGAAATVAARAIRRVVAGSGARDCRRFDRAVAERIRSHPPGAGAGRWHRSNTDIHLARAGNSARHYRIAPPLHTVRRLHRASAALRPPADRSLPRPAGKVLRRQDRRSRAI